MKPIAKFGELPFNVGGIKIFAAVDKSAQAIDEELYIISERSTRIFDLVNQDTSKVYTFMQMVSAGKDRKELSLSATAEEIQLALGKSQFAVKIYDVDSGDALGYAYKFFTNKIILSNGLEVQVEDYSKQTSEKVVAVAGVTLNKQTLSLPVGSTETLIPTIDPENATNKAVTWESQSPDKATVSSSGLVTAKEAGDAAIVVKTVDGEFTAQCLVTVSVPVVNVTSVTIAPKTKSLALDGEKTVQLTATVLPSTASNPSVSYVSSAPAVASVSNTGLVTALTAGETTITVTTADGSKTDTSVITVTDNA